MEKPSEIIKEYMQKMADTSPMESCGNPAVDLLAKHVTKLAAHADAVDAYLDTLTTYLDKFDFKVETCELYVSEGSRRCSPPCKICKYSNL